MFKLILRSSIAISSLLLFSTIGLSQKLTILHTNDMHSKLTGFGPESMYTPLVTNNDSTQGGFARLATIVKTEKSLNPQGTFVVDAGDFLMGTIFHAAEPETGFQLQLMKEIGYDYITLGNHEFDYGPQKLAEIINAAQTNGKIPQIVSSHMLLSSTSALDDELEKLVENKTILPYAIRESQGIKIGIIGIMGEDASDVAPLKTPVSFPKQAKMAAKLAKDLKTKNKADIVICLSHSGINKTQNGDFVGEDIKLAEKSSDIDIIISGHTHETTSKPVKINNTIIVQTGSYVKNLGKLELNIENKKIADYNFSLIPVDDAIKGDEKIQAKIETHKQLVEEKFLTPYNLSYSEIIAENHTNIYKHHQKGYDHSHLGTFIADAINYYIDTESEGSDIVIVAAGTIRENIVSGQLTVPDMFRVMSLGDGFNGMPGYPIAKIYITGHELKKLMEVLIMSSGEDNYVFTSGIKTFYNPDKGLLRKVQSIEIDGQQIDISKNNKKLYSIAANTYLLSFIGEIKKMSYGLIRITPKDKNGNLVNNMKNQVVDFDTEKPGIQEGKEWLALVKYIQQFEDTNGNGIPDLPKITKTAKSSKIAN